MQKLLRALLLVLLLVPGVHAREVPSLTRQVMDQAGLLTPVQVNRLESQLQELERKSTAQVAILTIPSLEGEDIKGFALKVVERWRLGRRGVDNGILILYTQAEDRFRIEVGYGLEGVIPDSVAGRIIRERMRTHADPKEGRQDFSAAFEAAVKKLSELIAQEHPEQVHPGLDLGKVPPVVWVAAVLVWLVSLMSIKASTVLGGVSGAGIAIIMGLSLPLILLSLVAGLFYGLIIQPIPEFVARAGLFFASNGGGFSGGGGGFGGGGADG